MRYVVLVAIGALSVVLSGSFVAGLNIAGIQVDLVLLIVVALAMIEKTSMPIVFAALSGLFMDILFSTVLGVYALSYTVVAAAVLFTFRKAVRINVLFLFAAGAASYLLKEIIMAVIVYALGARQFDFPGMLVRYILPASLLSGGLVLPSYWILSKLMKCNFMRPRKPYLADEF